MMKNSRIFLPEGETVTSRQNPFVKELCALSDKKQREKSGLFRFDGLKLCEEAILSGAPITVIAVRESTADRTVAWLEERLAPRVAEGKTRATFRVRILSDGVFEKISEEKSPDGIICLSKALDKFHKMTTINNILENLDSLCPEKTLPKLLFLSEIRDPGNLGTILRTASAFGIDCVFLSKDCADLFTPRTLRAAMGAIFRLPTLRIDGDGSDAVCALRNGGRRVYATALDDTARSLGSFPLSAGDCFVIGNEGHGLSEKMLAACTGRVYIPMAPGSESLNAAAAAAVCLWEQARTGM